jgi:alkylation response protein AidB-like acyl-CoA dehydrogenase
VDFELSEEQQTFYKSVVDFAHEVVEPEAGERDRSGSFDRTVWDRCGELGLCGLPISEAYGGSGADCVTTALALEALSYGGQDAGLGLSLGAHLVIGSKPIELHGTEEQKRHYLPKLATGEWIGSFGISEPDVGSDASAIKTRAVRDGDSWVLNGTKTFITNGPVCDVFTVVAVTDPEAGPGHGVSAFVLDKDTPGLSVGGVLDKMGNRSSPTSEMVMDDCRVDHSQMLGEEGSALWKIGFESFDWERTVMIGSAIGGMARSLDDSIVYAKQRESFGKPIAKHQAVAHKIAEMKVRLETARLMQRYAAWLKDQGKPHQMESSIAKAYMAECTSDNAEDAIQVHGGWGYIKDFPIERAWRDAKLTSLGGGTTEVQHLIISRMLLG